MKYTIKDFSLGKIAVINDGTTTELDKVIFAAIKTRQMLHDFKYYYVSNDIIIGVPSTNLPVVSVKALLKEIKMENFSPKRGDTVLAWNIDEEEAVIEVFLCEIKGAKYPYICVSASDRGKFKLEEEFDTFYYRNIKPVTQKVIQKDTLVYVKNYEEHTWEIRFYSHFKNGKHYCFNCQKKSTEIDEYDSWTIVTDINPFQ
jgi:hypothetical protein